MRLQKLRCLVVTIGVLVVLLSGCKSTTKESHAATAVPASDTPAPEVLPTDTSAPASAGDSNAKADLIFLNGTILTMEDGFPTASAIAIQGERILAVGEDDAVLAMADDDTQLIDLQGLTLLPGFADGHSHIFKVPEGMTLDEVQDLVLSYGFTSVNEMSSVGHLEQLMQAEADDQLRLRINVFVSYNNSYLDENGNMTLVKYWYPEHGPILDSDRMLRVPGIKIFVDGAGTPGRGCPAMREPYSELSTSADWFRQTCGSEYGDLYWTQEDLNKVVADAQEAGYRVSFHAMGDLGIETALDAIAFALDGQSNLLIRHQIQHSSYLMPDLMERYVAEDILSSVRGYFNTCDQDTYENHVAANRYDLPGLGIHAFLETDARWVHDVNDPTWSSTLNAMVQLYGLVTHQQLRADGTACTPDPWIAEHVISVDQALKMMTYEPIFAVSQEDVLGTLSPGKYADLVVLSADPHLVDPDDLKDIEVWMTMVAGQVQYCKPGHEPLCPGSQYQDSIADESSETPEESTLEPLTLKLYKNEQYVPAGTPIQVTIGWVCDTVEQMDDFFAAVSLSGTLDGRPLTDLDDYWGEVGTYEGSYGTENEDYISNWLYPLGVLEPGTHVLEITGTAARPITDGYDLNGDGVLDEQSGEFWKFSLQIIVEE
jgi:predicted amidohydrolase YtcJ